jgi:hypothetical protein
MLAPRANANGAAMRKLSSTQHIKFGSRMGDLSLGFAGLAGELHHLALGQPDLRGQSYFTTRLRLGFSDGPFGGCTVRAALAVRIPDSRLASSCPFQCETYSVLSTDRLARASFLAWAISRKTALRRLLLAHRVEPGIDQEGRCRRTAGTVRSVLLCVAASTSNACFPFAAQSTRACSP